MITYYGLSGGRLVPLDTAIIGPDVLWVDLLDPTESEERILEQQIHLDVPTREEMAEIETSSRLYFDDHCLYMTVDAVSQADPSAPRIEPITFIMTRQRLITVRYVEFRAFGAFVAGCERHPIAELDPWQPLTGLIEAVVDRTADTLERIGGDLESLSQRVFRHSRQVSHPVASRSLERVLRSVGQSHDLVTKVRTSLLSLTRLLSFALQHGKQVSPAIAERLVAVRTDLSSLREYDSVLAARVDFLLDATMGLISIEQNGIIKIFSVMSVVFLPPTLVASIYGMNFEFMPELKWENGYYYALGLILVAAVLPYLYFKIRRWL